MSRLPIRVRVAAAFTVALAAVLAGSGWFVYARLESHLTTALDSELRVRAQDLTSLAQQPHASFNRIDRSALIEPGESYAELFAANGNVITATASVARAPLLVPSELREALRRPIALNRARVPGLEDPSRLLATPLTQGGRRLVLVVGETTQNDVETLAALRNELVISGPIALLLAALAGYLLAGVSLRQVDAMRRRAAAVSADAPGERLPVPGTRDELQRLGETLNEMLDRLESSLARERAFVADAGHELRTPLALLRTELELALNHESSKEELRDALTSSVHEVDRLTQLAEGLLLIARTDRGELPLDLRQHRVGELFESVVNRFRLRADADGRELRADAPERVPIRGDRMRLEQSLGNLVDNAFRHGAGGILVSAVPRMDTIELHVSDEGVGFPPDFEEHAFDRFTRAGPGQSGAGLGLAIVRAIAEAHGGSAHAANRPEGGADVWLELPRVARLPTLPAPAVDLITHSL